MTEPQGEGPTSSPLRKLEQLNQNGLDEIADPEEESLGSLFNGSGAGDTPEHRGPTGSEDDAPPPDGPPDVTAMLFRAPPEPPLPTFGKPLRPLPGLEPFGTPLKPLPPSKTTPEPKPSSSTLFPELLDQIIRDPSYRPATELAPEDVEMSDAPSTRGVEDDDVEMEEALLQELERADEDQDLLAD